MTKKPLAKKQFKPPTFVNFKKPRQSSKDDEEEKSLMKAVSKHA
jgi:hypothetical protein